jgi:ABC-2 type transport system ATP-binding protein
MPEEPVAVPAIETRALARRFGNLRALEAIDLRVGRGEMFGLVGPDGAGKSTLIRLLCGVLLPTSGEATVLGHDLRREPERIKARLGYLSQGFSLYGDLTIDENLEFFARLHGLRDFRRRREELLDFTRLGPFRRRLAERLSGGMKKKLALACTLIHTPDLILLDEPSTGVDPLSRGDFWKILSVLLQTGLTIFLTTPYLDEVERCHRIGLLHQGRLLHQGTPDEMRALLPGKVARLSGLGIDETRRAGRLLREKMPSLDPAFFGHHLHLHLREGESQAAAVRQALAEAEFGNALLEEIPPSLEDVFVSLLRE